MAGAPDAPVLGSRAAPVQQRVLMLGGICRTAQRR
jgi:hypothetical protein